MADEPPGQLMDLYLTSLALGGVGLAAMAFTGLAHHGHDGASHHGASQPGHGHAGHGHAGHGHAHGNDHGHAARDHGSHPLLALVSPRTLFSFCLGFGTAGLVLRGLLQGPLLVAAAAAGALLFEWALVGPLWRFIMRFESNPALTLDSAVTSDATAASTFDRNGQGLVALELDGQLVQLLGTLSDTDRALGVTVRTGAKLRIEEVDTARNRCTVTLA